MSKYTVYMHTFPNGKRYIGITAQSVKNRWHRGLGYKDQTVFKAIQKYGWDNIKHEILFTDLTQEQAEQKEQELINKYQSTSHLKGYNISLGGNHKGKTSPETLEKLRKNSTGRIKSIEERIKLSKSNKGQKRTPETIEKFKKIQNNRSKEWEEKRIKAVQAKRSKKTAMIDSDGHIKKIFNTLTECATFYKVDVRAVSMICNGKQKQTRNGLKFKYI